jgi:hypothetical protein
MQARGTLLCNPFRTASELLSAWLVRMLRLGTTNADPGIEFMPGEAACMRRLARAEPAGRWIEFMESMQRQFALVDGLNLDRRQIWIATVLGLQRMAAG